MQRRQFLRATGAATGFALLGSLPFVACSVPTDDAGPLGPPDRNGLRLLPGYQSRVVATSGELVADTGHRWHPNPDGGAVFAQPDGGWVYVSNDEASNGAGGASMIRFDRNANIVAAGPILTGTSRNCAGGATPWDTWLSCEEIDGGQVWECDPLGDEQAVVRPAMGTFAHEAAAADPTRKVIYLTEDKPDGALYRFSPETWGDLSSGTLEALVETSNRLGWEAIPDPEARNSATRFQLSNTKPFAGGEGAWFQDDFLYFTTKGDNRVWRLDVAQNQLDVIYDIATSPNPVLSGVDNVTRSVTGDLYVCEDGGNMEVVTLSANGTVRRFARIEISGSEVTGVAFDPSGTRMYVSSQRNPGATFEITGPFSPAAR